MNGVQRFALRHADGTHRLVNAVQSPDAWIEDFGSGTLAGGRATVGLDADFAALVETGDYAVFPVPLGDCNGLYIASQTASGFEVRELRGGTSSVAFRYRVVARPQDTGKAQRMAKYDAPKIAIPTESDLPKSPGPLSSQTVNVVPIVPQSHPVGVPDPAPAPRTAPAAPPQPAAAPASVPSVPPAPNPAPPART